MVVKKTAAAAKKPQNVYQRLSAMRSSVTGLSKSGHNAFQKYNYIPHEVVSDVVRPLMVEHGLDFGITFVEILDRSVVGKSVVSLLKFNMTWTSIDTGEQLVETWIGEGADTSDKGTAKAATNAQKYYFLKRFQFGNERSTEADEHDPDTVPKIPHFEELQKHNINVKKFLAWYKDTVGTVYEDDTEDAQLLGVSIAIQKKIDAKKGIKVASPKAERRTQNFRGNNAH